ncbi:MAG: hypothetical protein OXO51_02550 [Gemmatimonadota bacterium]|nr:hypothetical protein [Gemmatimonadota bacterium]
MDPRFWKVFLPAQYCKDCHFLSRDLGGGRNPWTQEERENQQTEQYDAKSECAKGIWGYSANHPKEKIQEYITTDMKDSCFYIRFDPDKYEMSFDAASELHRIHYENRHLWWGYVLTIIALFISAGALLYNVISQNKVTPILRKVYDLGFNQFS